VTDQQPVTGVGPTAPTGTVRLTIQGNVLTSNAITPSVAVNGYRMPSRYGTQDLTVYAGRTRLDVHCQWMRQYGQASLDFVVAPGQIIEVRYASPWHQFARGNLGFAPQPRPGRLLGLALLGGFVVVALAMLAAGVFAG
jgi:hypothetical protein